MPFVDVADLCRRAELDYRERTLLADAGALASLPRHRNGARWSVAGVEQQRPLFSASPDEDAVDLPAPPTGEDLLADYATLGLTLGAHPIALLRERLHREHRPGDATQRVTRPCSGPGDATAAAGDRSWHNIPDAGG